MTDYGVNKGAVCELLNCSLSELPKRCPEPYDMAFAISYLARKSQLEKDTLDEVRK